MYHWFAFALFHKLKRGKEISWTSRTASTQNFHSRLLEKQRQTQLWYTATSECSNSRHALKQEVYFVQHNCLFLYDTKWNSACLTQEPRSAFCTALLSKVSEKGSKVRQGKADSSEQYLRQVSSTANSRSLNSQGICELGELLLEFNLLLTIPSSCLIKQLSSPNPFLFKQVEELKKYLFIYSFSNQVAFKVFPAWQQKEENLQKWMCLQNCHRVLHLQPWAWRSHYPKHTRGSNPQHLGTNWDPPATKQRRTSLRQALH